MPKSIESTKSSRSAIGDDACEPDIKVGEMSQPRFNSFEVIGAAMPVDDLGGWHSLETES